jgi:hypothetical protein
LKELGLLNNDVILQAIIHSYKEIMMKYKGKEVCPSSHMLSGIVESMVSPQGTEVGSTSHFESKGEERK